MNDLLLRIAALIFLIFALIGVKELVHNIYIGVVNSLPFIELVIISLTHLFAICFFLVPFLICLYRAKKKTTKKS